MADTSAGLHPSDFTTEKGGDFAESEFPRADRDELLGEWLRQAAEEDVPTQRAFVNWRGNRHIARRLRLQYARTDFDDHGSAQRLRSQIEEQSQIARDCKARVPTHLVTLVEGRAATPESDLESSSASLKPVVSRR